MAKLQIKENHPIVIDKNQRIPGTEFFEMWNVGHLSNYKAQVPIFNVNNMHGLNAIIGYVMLVNSNVGKVLYRGQTKLYCGENGSYSDLLPSICHLNPEKNETMKAAKVRWINETKIKNELLDNRIQSVLDDPDLLKQVDHNFDCKDNNSSEAIKVVVESLLQHYGDSTRCMDFVDNHWIALWFGLHEWILNKDVESGTPQECFYKKRTLKLPKQLCQDSQAAMRQCFFNELKMNIGDTSISQSQDVVDKLLKKYSHKLAFAEDQFLYLILFVANTLPEHAVTHHTGVYSNPEMIVVDLRRALPSVFLRPGAQHGWTVKMKSKKKNKNRGDYSFAPNIVAILRIPLSLADELIGGALLSQENLFPPEDYDQGYRILLQRQELATKKKDNITNLDKAFQNMPITKYK